MGKQTAQRSTDQSLTVEKGVRNEGATFMHDANESDGEPLPFVYSPAFRSMLGYGYGRLHGRPCEKGIFLNHGGSRRGP
jgi:hypothetical protein